LSSIVTRFGAAHFTAARIDELALRAGVTQILIAYPPTKLKHDEALDY
jgi:D-serine deaminase-like pyridoxal phosphate-dependent protein